MGAAIPRVITPSSASGAQVVEGGLNFFQGSGASTPYLTWTPSSSGNRSTWTVSCWAKPSTDSSGYLPFIMATDDDFAWEYEGLFWFGNNLYYIDYISSAGGGTYNVLWRSSAAYRDIGWYHMMVVKVDNSTVKLYVNGEEVTNLSSSTNNGAQSTWLNVAGEPMYIGGYIQSDGTGYSCKNIMNEFYFIDGQALEPSEFGYTDPLTNTWRPKKFSGYDNPNNGTTWSSSLSTNDPGGFGSGYEATKGFDGLLTTYAGSDSYASDLTLTFGPATPLIYNSSVEIMTTNSGAATITFNGTSTGALLDTWQTIATGSGSISSSNSIVVDTESTNQYATITAIRVDGYVLIDGTSWGGGGDNSVYLPMDGTAPIGKDQSGKGNDWTPVNFGGSAGLDKATGALPILNTVNGGKGALVGVRKDYSPQTPNIVKESGCVYFDGAYDCIYTPDSSDFSVGSGDFTLELWFYRTRSGGDDWMAIQTDGTSANSGVGLHVWSTTYGGSDANKIHGRVRIGSSNINCTGTTVIGTSSWHHAAFVRDGTNLRIYLDGVQEGVTAVSTDAINDPSAPFIVGAVTALGESGVEGYLSNVRYVVGTCLYPSGTTFTPSAAPLTNVTNTKLLCCQSSTDATAYAVSPAAFTKVGGTFASHSAISGKCVLALPLVGDANDVSNDINSGISTAKTITPTGTPTASSAQSNFYGNSYYFDGSGDYLAVTDSTDLKFGTDDYTIEFWVKPATVAYYWMFSKRNDYADVAPYTMMSNTSGQFEYASSSNDSSYNIVQASFGSYKALEWTHVAVVKNGGVITGYCNGVGTELATGVTLGPFEHAEPLHIGDMPTGGSYDLSGYMQDFRIYKGAAKYTSDFIPASTNPDILPETPSGVALSSNLTKVTDGSVKFDGTGDVVYAPDSSDFTLGTNDFTAECWIKRTRTSVDEWFFVQGDGVSTNTSFGLHVDATTNYLEGRVQNGDAGSSVDIPGTTPLTTGIWYHCAWVRDGTTMRLYLNGVQENSSTSLGSANVQDSTSTMNVGALMSNGTNGTACYLSNARLVNGTCLYPDGTTFTPPTEPLTAVTNTKLLCCQSNTSAIDAAVVPDAGTGTALLNAPLSSTPFTDSSSTGAAIGNEGSIAAASAGTNNFDITNAASLDGSSQRLSTDNTNLSFIGTWTLDVWFKLDSSASGYNALVNTGYGASSGPYMYFGLNDDELPYVEGGSAGGTSTAVSAFVVNKDQWYQMRVRSDGVIIKQYIDGKLVVTHGVNTTDLSSAGTKTIGSLLDNGNNANNFHGLIGPVRYVSSDLGPPVAGGESTSSGALSNTPDRPDLIAVADAAPTSSNPFNTNINTVRGQETGYCTWNPLDCYANAPTEGNLKGGVAGTSAWKHYRATTAMNSGKYYWEVYDKDGTWASTSASSGYVTGYALGSGPSGFNINGQNINAGSTGLWGRQSAPIYGNGAPGMTGETYFDSAVAYDWNAFAFDADAGKLWTSTNGVWVDGDPATGVNPTWSNVTAGGFAMGGSYGSSIHVYANFGQKPFRAAPPEGFQPINSANLQSPGVVRPDSVVGVTTWKGNSTYPRHIDAFNFRPDLVWTKNYSTDGWGWPVWDSVRGAGANYAIRMDMADTQGSANVAPYVNLSSLNSNGFTLDTTSSTDVLNGTGDGVAFCWKAGGNPGISTTAFWKDGKEYASAAAAGLTAGTITPTACSIGTKQGFSIIKFRGNGVNAANTVPHGLSQTPDFIMTKDCDYGWNWSCRNTGRSDLTGWMTTDAWSSAWDTPWANGSWDPSSNTSTTFAAVAGSSTSNYTNWDGHVYINYVWHNVPGLQKFGTWTNNNLDDGTFVELGFRPAILLLKCTDATEEWYIINDDRYPNNLGPGSSTLVALQPSDVNNEAATVAMAVNAGVDFLSNGFKIRSTDTSAGEISFGTRNYIYAAWAHQAVHTLYGGQSNAR